MRAWVFCLAVLLAGPAWAAPHAVSGLYEATAYVTGTRAETRAEGIATCFRRVLVKVSGNPGLAEDARVAPFEAQAAEMVEDLAYQDRMSDEPHHDEQGTRDRPFDLTVHFDPARIDAALAALGETPWLAARPRLLVRVMVEDRGTRFAISADAEADERQREALLAAADRYGMRVALTPVDGAAPLAGADQPVLSGRLVWDPATFGWAGDWHLAAGTVMKDWRIEGVSFDDAFRDAMAGSLAALSGH